MFLAYFEGFFKDNNLMTSLLTWKMYDFNVMHSATQIIWFKFKYSIEWQVYLHT